MNQDFTVTPWDVSGKIDYKKLIEEFGTEPIDDALLERWRRVTGSVPFALRRKIFFSHRDLKWILDRTRPARSSSSTQAGARRATRTWAT